MKNANFVNRFEQPLASNKIKAIVHVYTFNLKMLRTKQLHTCLVHYQRVYSRLPGSNHILTFSKLLWIW